MLPLSFLSWLWNISQTMQCQYEPPHDKTDKMACAPSEDSDQPGHPPSLIRVFTAAWRKLGPLATHWAHSEYSDQTGRRSESSLGAHVILLVFWRYCKGFACFGNDSLYFVCWTWVAHKSLSLMSHVMRKPVNAICERQRCRSACASAIPWL